MTATPYPLPRETRETAILVGNGTPGPYGPTQFRVFDIADVQVLTRPQDSDAFARSDATVTKTANAEWDTVSVTFPAAIPPTTEFLIVARRTHEREVAVFKGGSLNVAELEKELSKQASVISELRRDVRRGGSISPGTPGHVLAFNEDGDVIPGVSQGRISEAQANADEVAAKLVLVNEAARRAQEYAAAAGAATGRLDRRSVAELIADDLFTYDEVEVFAEGAAIQVGPGDIVTAQGFRYEVAAADAIDAHVETAGAVKLYVLPSAGRVYVEAFGAVGDWDLETSTGTDDTAAFRTAVRAANGSILCATAGKTYHCDFIQMSGVIPGAGYIGTDVFRFDGQGCSFYQKDYVGETPPGTGAGTYLFHGANFRVFEVMNFKGRGPHFANIGVDALPATGTSGSLGAYNTRCGGVRAQACQDVLYSNIELEEFAFPFDARLCGNVRWEKLKSDKAGTAFHLNGNEHVSFDDLTSLNARFGYLAAVDDDLASNTVYATAGGAVVYEIVPGANGSTTGVKNNQGYCFILAGNQTVQGSKLFSRYNGSDALRIQSGPSTTARINIDDVDIAHYNRHAISDYTSAIDSFNVTNIRIASANDPNYWNGVPPATQAEAQNPAVPITRENILDYWAFRQPRDGSYAFLHRAQNSWRDIGIVSEPSNGVAVAIAAEAARPRYAGSRRRYGLTGWISTRDGGSGGFRNIDFLGQVTSTSGAIQYVGGDIELDNCRVITTGGTSTSNTVQNIFGILAGGTRLHIKNCLIRGGMYSFRKADQAAVINDFKSFNTEYRTPGVSVFRGQNHHSRLGLISKGDTFTGPFLFSTAGDTSSLGGIIFDDPNLLSAIGVPGADGLATAAGGADAILFKRGQTYWMLIDQQVVNAPRHLRRIHRTLRFTRVVRLDAAYTAMPPLDEGAITESVWSPDFTPSGTRKLATIYANNGTTAGEFRCSVTGAGSGRAHWAFSATVNGLYLVEFAPISTMHDQTLIAA